MIQFSIDLLLIYIKQDSSSMQSTPIYNNYSEGRVKKDIERIHLFIWLDQHKPHRFLFNTINSKYQGSLCSRFGFDPGRLELVRS
jgi:hypothetical protein